MLVAVAFSNADNARKIADALGRQGMRAIAVTSGAAVLRQMQAVTVVVSGARLDDMTALRLRQLLPREKPLLLLSSHAPVPAGIECLPLSTTKAQLAERIDRLLDEQESLIAKAKRAVIQKSGVDEAGAHHLLQKRAMNQGISVKEAAKELLMRYKQED